MKQFTLKQCALALCLGLASFLPGQSIATNAPDVSSPIGITLAEQEESGYAFKSWNTHAEYERIYKNSNGTYTGSRSKQMWLELPPETSSKVYLKASLKNVSQANSITFQVNREDRSFDNGAIWISPEDCSLSGTTQEIPFGARVTAPGAYSYTVEAYVNQEDETPVATWDATFYFMENKPSITAPGNLYANSFGFDVVKGDLDVPIKLEVQYFSYNGDNRPTSFTAEGFSTTDNRVWATEPMPLEDKHYSATFTCDGILSGQFQIYLKDADGKDIEVKVVRVCFPLTPAASDLEAINRLASLNPSNTDLQNFVNNGLWKEDLSAANSNVKVEWIIDADSAHVSRLEIENQESLELDLKGLDYIQTLVLSSNKTIKAPLDLSHMGKLERLYMYNGVSLTYNEVILPEGFKKSNVSATSRIREIGTPRDDWSVEVPNNTIIDLTAYVGTEVDGAPNTFEWKKNGGEATLPSAGGQAVYLRGQVGDRFECTIKNDSFPNWQIQTATIYLTQGEISYNAEDVAGLQKLAADNPQNQEIQDFIKNEIWKQNDLYPEGSPMGVEWTVDDENIGRLSHLRLNLNGCYVDSIAPTQMDLSAFTELTYFNTSSNYQVKEMDFSKNTKLQEIILEYAYVMTNLDLSSCKDLRRLTLRHLREFESLDITPLQQLEYLELEDNRLLTSVELSNLPNLKEVELSSCPQLKTVDGLENLSLTSLILTYVDSTFNGLLDRIDLTQLTRLDLSSSDVKWPELDQVRQLQYIGLPKTTQTIDLNDYPQLKSLNVGRGSSIHYSGVKNYKDKSWWDSENQIWYDGVSYSGITKFDVPGTMQLEGEWYPCIYVGDTIDLSADAFYNDIPSTFIWINNQYRTEEKELFLPTDKPGVFVVNPDAAINDQGIYWCKIWNKAFSQNVTINSWSGWVMEGNYFKVLGSQKELIFETKDVEALASIVNNSKNQALIDWFENKGWKKSGYTNLGENLGGVRIEWSNEPTKRLTSLSLSFMDELLSGTVDVSTLDRLEQLELPFTNISGVKLPTNPEKLKWLNLSQTKVTTLDVSDYTNLLHLDVQNSALKSCDLSKNTKLEHLQLGGTTIALDEKTEYPNLNYFMTADNVASLDLSKMPKLEELMIMNDQLKFSDVKNAHQLSSVSGDSYLTASDVVYLDASMVAKEAVLDFSSELLVGTTPSTIHGKDSLIMTGVSGKYKVDWEKAKLLCIDLTNDMFPGWTLHYPMSMLTEKGDVNYDDKVNVQDVTATAAHLVDLENQLVDYSLYAGDVNENEEIDAGDLVGIVNIIMNKPFKSSELRAAYRPTVDVQMDEKNFLTMENEVPVAALYLEIAGANAETALLADAARLTQASSLKGDTLRIVAYSLDGRTIASGKHIIAQLQPGMRIVKATFSDAQAALLQTTGDLLSTANETIASEVEAKAIYNYPNPTAGQTTFCYALAQPAQSVEVQFFASNGAFVARLQGLPTAAGSQSYATTLPLSAGVYYYRLVIDGKQVTATNTLIIK